jgi:hypothetical protein
MCRIIKSKGAKKVLIFIIVLVCTIVASVVAISHFVPGPSLFARAFMRVMYIKGQQVRKRLLCETDYKALLDACRELSKEKAAGRLKRQLYRLSDRGPEVAGFPKAILDLRPNTVYIDYDGRVQLEMMGGLDSFGVNAYPEGYQKPPGASTFTFKFGDIELIDGLWYYDESYKGDPEYQKWIAALIEKGKARQR